MVKKCRCPQREVASDNFVQARLRAAPESCGAELARCQTGALPNSIDHTHPTIRQPDGAVFRRALLYGPETYIYSLFTHCPPT